MPICIFAMFGMMYYTLLGRAFHIGGKNRAQLHCVESRSREGELYDDCLDTGTKRTHTRCYKRQRLQFHFYASNKMEPQRGGGIPKIIHQIWLGSNPRPDYWMKSVKDFAAKHGYKYMLWGEKNMKGLGIDSFEGLRKAYSAFRDQLAGKADIIRLLALYKYGGIYIDADSVIMKSQKFADFLDDNRASVFFGWENLSAAFTRKLGNIDPHIQRTRRMVANGLIGAKKGHPFIKRLLDGVGQSVTENTNEMKLEAWRAIGPHYTTKLYNATRQEFPDVHVYPMKYFYPRHWHGISDPELHTKVKIPGQSMLFQYGYSTNKFNKIFARKTRKRARTLDNNDEENGV